MVKGLKCIHIKTFSFMHREVRMHRVYVRSKYSCFSSNYFNLNDTW